MRFRKHLNCRRGTCSRAAALSALGLSQGWQTRLLPTIRRHGNHVSALLQSITGAFRQYYACVTCSTADFACTAALGLVFWFICAFGAFGFFTNFRTISPAFRPLSDPLATVWDLPTRPLVQTAEMLPQFPRCKPIALVVDSVFDPADFAECAGIRALAQNGSESNRGCPRGSLRDCLRVITATLRARIAAAERILQPTIRRRCSADVVLTVVAGSPTHQVIRRARAGEPEAAALLAKISPELGLAPNSWRLQAACSLAPRVVWVGGGGHGDLLDDARVFARYQAPPTVVERRIRNTCVSRRLVYANDTRSLGLCRVAAVLADSPTPLFAARLARASRVLLRDLDGRAIVQTADPIVGAPRAAHALYDNINMRVWEAILQSLAIFGALLLRTFGRRVDIFLLLVLGLLVSFVALSAHVRARVDYSYMIGNCVDSALCDCADYAVPRFSQPARLEIPVQRFVDRSIELDYAGNVSGNVSGNAAGNVSGNAARDDRPDCMAMFLANRTGACFSGVLAGTVTERVSEVVAEYAGFRGPPGQGLCRPYAGALLSTLPQWGFVQSAIFWFSMAVAVFG